MKPAFASELNLRIDTNYTTRRQRTSKAHRPQISLHATPHQPRNALRNCADLFTKDISQETLPWPSNPGPLAYACNYERPFHMFHSNIRTCTHPTSLIHRNDNKQAADHYTPACGFLFLCVMTCKNSVCVLTSRKMSLALLAACETTYTNAGDGAATASMPMGRTTQGPDARGAVVVA